MAKHPIEEARIVAADRDIDDEFDRQVEEAEQELQEARVNFRWGKEQLAVVKKAAALIGVPYQTYLKQVVYKQAVEDIKATNLAGVR